MAPLPPGLEDALATLCPECRPLIEEWMIAGFRALRDDTVRTLNLAGIKPRIDGAEAATP